MSSKHTAEFKAKVALDALSHKNDTFAKIASKYEISVKEVEIWVSELQGNATAAFGGSDDGQVIDVAIESDNESFVHAVNYGVEEEGLDLGSIYKWSGIGVVTVVVFIVVLIYFSQFALNNAKENVNVTSSYYEIEQLTEDGNERLNSYGVVDLEEGVYHIPIDQAINKLAVD
jgi:predicted HTH domain antitoxin